MVSVQTSNRQCFGHRVCSQNPELARKAIITAFLFKNPKRWTDEDHSLEALQEEEDRTTISMMASDEEQVAPEQDVDCICSIARERRECLTTPIFPRSGDR